MRRVCKTATQGKTKGYDAGKQVHGRKRHVLVDTIGLVMRILVTAADCDDRDGLRGLLSAYFAGGVQRLKKLWVAALKHSHKIDLEVVAKPAAGFAVLPLGCRAYLCLAGEFSAPFERL